MFSKYVSTELEEQDLAPLHGMTRSGLGLN